MEKISQKILLTTSTFVLAVLGNTQMVHAKSVPSENVMTVQAKKVATGHKPAAKKPVITAEHPNRARRRMIESSGNYAINNGNGYIGAYQFSASTIAGISASTGMKWSMAPKVQDAFADAYANQRYGGWQNVPTFGGW